MSDFNNGFMNKLAELHKNAISRGLADKVFDRRSADLAGYSAVMDATVNTTKAGPDKVVQVMALRKAKNAASDKLSRNVDLLKRWAPGSDSRKAARFSGDLKTLGLAGAAGLGAYGLYRAGKHILGSND